LLESQQTQEKRRFLISASLFTLILAILTFIFTTNTYLDKQHLEDLYIDLLGLGLGLGSASALITAYANKLLWSAYLILGSFVIVNTVIFLVSTSFAYMINIICFTMIAMLGLITLNSLAAYIISGWGVLLVFGAWFSQAIFVSKSSTQVPAAIGLDDTIVLGFIQFVIIWLASYLVNNLSKVKGIVEQQALQLAGAVESLEIRQNAIEETSHKVLELSTELKSASQQQAAGSQEQASNVAQVQISVNGLLINATQITQMAQEVNAAIEQLVSGSRQIEKTTNLSNNKSQSGLEAVRYTIAVCQEVAVLYKELSHTLQELNSWSQNSSHILELLNSLATETHLLALNAAIEAAGAGEYGERFGVVAQEVKLLADRSHQSSGEAVKVLSELEAALKNTIHLVEGGYLKAQEMEQVASKAGVVITEMREISDEAQGEAITINKISEGIKQLSETIKLATTQQRTASVQVVGVLSELNVIAQQNTESSLLVSTSAGVLESMSRQLQTTLT
jgi:methyl-accepting chemotaxis protein